MSKLTRFTQKLFGSTAGLNQIGQFGSLAAGSPTSYSGSAITPTIIQSLSNYLTGWFGAVLGGNSPAIEDLNAICYLYSYQLAYLFQQGIAEYDASTTYYAGSMVNVGGTIFVSAADNNIGNATSNSSWWTNYKQLSYLNYQAGAVASWTAPAGVTSVKLFAKTLRPGVGNNFPGVLDAFGNAVTCGMNADSATGGTTTAGQLGTGSAALRVSVPAVVSGGYLFQKFLNNKGQGSYAGAISNGKVYTWGSNNFGQLGLGDTTYRSTPTMILGLQSVWKVIAYQYFNAALATTGELFTWGGNNSGCQGNGSTPGVYNPVPTQVLGGHLFSDLSAAGGNQTVLAIDQAGVTWAWGSNSTGSLGLGDTTDRSSPVMVLGLSGIPMRKVYAGTGFGNASYALSQAGDLYAWGNNGGGQLGLGDLVSRSSPVIIPGGLKFTSLNVDNNESAVYAITTSGDMYAWGFNGSGQLGIGTGAGSTSVSTPTLVLGGLKWAKVRSQQNVAFGITTTGLAYAWGSEYQGLLGDGGSGGFQHSPVPVIGGIQFTDIQLNNLDGLEANAYGLSSNGTLYTWGNNFSGEQMTGSGGNVVSTPTMVLGGISGNVRDQISVTEVPVVPGTTYNISLNQFQATFGTTVVGSDVEQLVIEYGT